mmetsp:Transcript_10338/g.30247  ORF Transcript_10338/g.30247 Transcript_10338/m.30247 type:complete len:289 (-) Transcript_10338:555-1421(-)|eukprot:CAMPEP_0172372876 /NCGR_PEP_ID=MMETSP1060-20121228/49467_1 /TAXON_ID=37318 /ORGANISM="Pseudo-nitzschia pungens, Strain cf. cingulata" /LENGTH=288 /DNA_ID=CAMNT_0013099015 /DNA_START=131 /DNA_END=997 /DNA_ORIENTATION=+
MTSTSGNEDNGYYDNAIVAIAIGNESDMETDGSDGAFSDIDAALDDVLLDNVDIDHEETRLRQYIGDIPNEIEMDPNRFASLPPGVQIKLILELRDREKATLLEKLKGCSNAVDKLKEQLYASEDRRMELEHELDEENEQIEDMKREFNRMREAYQGHAQEIQRIKIQMMSRVSTSFQNSEGAKEQKRAVNSSSNSMSFDQRDSQDVKPRTKSKNQLEFERKLERSSQYREEFERFKEFQEYYQMVTTNGTSSDGMCCDITKDLNEDYRRMLEFQLAYERILFSNSNI